MATYLEVVNRVLVLLREDAVTTLDETQVSALVAEFVNDAKEEVEGANKWSIQRTTIQVVTDTVGTYAYTLTGAGMRHRVLQVRNATEGYDLEKPPSYQYMNTLFQSPNTSSTGQPQYWDYNGSQGGDRVINIFPHTWSEAQTLNFNMYLPQATLTEIDDEIILPENMIIKRAHMLAVEERGDDGGASLQVLEARYDRALDDAIAADQDNYPNETVWSVD